MARLFNNGFLMDIKKYFYEDFNKAYENVKDIEVTDETIHYLIGYMSKESKFYREKELYQTDDKETLERLGLSIATSIIKDLYNHTDLSNFSNSYDSKFFLFYFLNRCNRLIPHDAVYKYPNGNEYLFFGSSRDNEEMKRIEKSMNNAFKTDITNYGLFPIKLPTGVLVDKDGLLKRTDLMADKLEDYYQGIYHTIMVHNFFMKKLVESNYKEKEKTKLYIPIMNNNRHYLMRFFNNKGRTAKYTGSSFTNTLLTNLTMKEIINDFDFTSVFDAPFFKMYKTKSDIMKDFSKDKDKILFILELEVPVNDILFEGSVELYNSVVDLSFVTDSDFLKVKKISELNMFSLYAKKNPKALHYLKAGYKAVYHLKKEDVWIQVKVDKKSNSTTDKYMFSMSKPMNNLSKEQNPKNKENNTIISPKYSAGYLDKKEFNEIFGFNPLPTLTKVEKEIDLFVISKNQ